MSQTASELAERISQCIKLRTFSDALELFNDEKYAECIESNSWKLIPILCDYLSEENSADDAEVVNCCEVLLEQLAWKANPNEALLEFLEHMDAPYDLTFRVLLRMLKIVFTRMTSGQVHGVEWCFHTIQTHLVTLPDPESSHWDSDDIQWNVDIVSLVLDFAKHVATLSDYSTPECSANVKYVLSAFLIDTLSVCFPFVAWNNVLTCKTEVDIVALVLKLLPNPYHVLEHIATRSMKRKCQKKSVKEKPLEEIAEEPEDPPGPQPPLQPTNEIIFSYFDDKSFVSNLALAMFFHDVMLLDAFSDSHFPAVYDVKFILLCLLSVAPAFFKSKNEKSIERGLNYMDHVLNQFSTELIREDLFFDYHKQLLTKLNNIMVFSEVEELRKLALKCFKRYILLFNAEGRFWLLLNLRDSVDHVGTAGFLITMIKDLVQTAPASGRFFTGKLLSDLILKYCAPKKGAATDVVESSDPIISALNLLTFVVLKDKDGSLRFKGHMRDVDRVVLAPLRQAIASGKTSNQDKMRELEAQTGSDLDQFSVTVKGQELPLLSLEEQKTVLRCMANAVDLMDSLMVRLCECVHDSYGLDL